MPNLMSVAETEFEDYTGMSEGELVEGGIIKECSRCGRLGRFSVRNDRNVWDHRRTTPEETRVSCVV